VAESLAMDVYDLLTYCFGHARVYGLNIKYQSDNKSKLGQTAVLYLIYQIFKKIGTGGKSPGGW
jgi:hypothetical protein